MSLRLVVAEPAGAGSDTRKERCSSASASSLFSITPREGGLANVGTFAKSEAALPWGAVLRTSPQFKTQAERRSAQWTVGD